jgi:predicted amidohydrolase YtcJ
MRAGTIQISAAVLSCAIAPTGGAIGVLQADRPADVILVSGRVYTMDPDRPRAEAIAVRDGRILFVGSTLHVGALKGPATRVVQLQELTVVPGFVDGHLHLERLTGSTSLEGRDIDVESSPVPMTSLTEGIQKGVQLALSYGVTGAHDIGSSLEAIEAYKALVAAGQLPFRINAYPRVDDAGEKLERILAAGRYQDPEMRLQVRGISVALDGPLASRRAALLAPYADEPSTSGALRLPAEELQRILERALKAGFTAAIHAIGTRWPWMRSRKHSDRCRPKITASGSSTRKCSRRATFHGSPTLEYSCRGSGFTARSTCPGRRGVSARSERRRRMRGAPF